MSQKPFHCSLIINKKTSEDKRSVRGSYHKHATTHYITGVKVGIITKFGDLTLYKLWHISYERSEYFIRRRRISCAEGAFHVPKAHFMCRRRISCAEGTFNGSLCLRHNNTVSIRACLSILGVV